MHPAFQHFRPMILGVILFLTLNTVAALSLNPASGLSNKLNNSMDNYLPQKLVQLDKAFHDPKTDHRAKVLFLGTSQTNNGFSTQDFEAAMPGGVNAFNLGLPGTRYDVMVANLEAYRRRYGNPDVLLIELSPTIMENQTTQFYLPALQYHALISHNPGLFDFIWNSPILSDSVRRELAMDSLSPFYAFRQIFSPLNIQDRITHRVDAFYNNHIPKAMAAEGSPSLTTPYGNIFKSPPQMNPEALHKGWFPKPISPMMTSSKGIQANAMAAKRFYLDSMTEVKFNKLVYLLNYCEQNHIKTVLVTWPNHPAFLAQYEKSSFYDTYQSGLQALLSTTDIAHIDLALGPKDSTNGMFADTRHLSPKGARLYSQRLAHRLFALPDYDLHAVLSRPDIIRLQLSAAPKPTGLTAINTLAVELPLQSGSMRRPAFANVFKKS